jgi:hypothetical protein
MVPVTAFGNEASPALLRAEECMLVVLNETPGITEGKLGISTFKGQPFPYVEYRAAEGASWEQPTRFDLHAPHDPNRGPFSFWGLVPGICPALPGENCPDIHVTQDVVKGWKSRCGVAAVVLME